MRLFFCLLLCAIPFSAAVAAPYSQITVEYKVSRGFFTLGTMRETYVATQNHYRITNQTRPTSLITAIKPGEAYDITSEGTITPQGLRPDTFDWVRAADPGRNASASFDWINKTVTLTSQDGKHTFPLPPDTQDRASVMYQFMFLAMEGAGRLDFHRTDGRKVDIYNYTVQPGGRVEVPAGTFDTLYVASVPEPDKQNRTEVWLAREHNWLPCKMVITDGDGSKYTQELTAFNAQP
jgi:hypothetical protein